MTAIQERRLGYFSRLLDDGDPAIRYQRGLEQIQHAEQEGFHSAWVAQHHFHPLEGGLPAPFVFLSHVAAHTRTIRLGTGIVTLPLENAIRVAEDASVFDLLSGGRLEFGVGPGGTSESFEAFGLDGSARSAIMLNNLDTVIALWRGDAIGGNSRIYPLVPRLLGRIWQATFTINGAIRAGQAGDGLLLSRTQPRPADARDATLAEIQNPLIDAYLAALPPGCAPRIMASRSVFIADDREQARKLTQENAWRYSCRVSPDRLLHEAPPPMETLIRSMDLHVGTAGDVISSLQADSVLDRVTEIAFQVHPIDPPHELTLRSIELAAREVAPALGLMLVGS